MKRNSIATILLLAGLALIAGCASLGSQQTIDHVLTNLEGCDREYQGSLSGGIGQAPTIVVHINCKAKAVQANGDAKPAAPAPASVPPAQ